MTIEIQSSMLQQFTNFGDFLRFLRRRAGLTQLELSLAVGYSDAQVSRLEQNLRLPDIPTLQARFVPALGLDNEPKAIARLLELAADVRREDSPAPGVCPFKGLAHFDEADADLFAGREELTGRITQRVLTLGIAAENGEPRFLGIVGASGSGKSSLLRAGVIPALRWEKSAADWGIHLLAPGAHPLESLALALLGEKSSVADVARLVDDLAGEPRSLQLIASRLTENRPERKLLLAIDQFEELFSLCHSVDERTQFLDNLITAVTQPGGLVVVVAAIRADFYSQCAWHAGLRNALARGQEYIGAMNEPEMRRAIEEPARAGRWDLESGLVDTMLRDVGHEPGALPLLSHALFETWQRRRGRLMTLSGYASSGGVRGAIAETAESVYVDQLTPEQRELARRVFLRLTEPGPEAGAEDTRRRVGFSELVDQSSRMDATMELLRRLAAARLVTVGQESVEVAHEALIREWPRLRGWLDDNRRGLKIHRQLTVTALDWSNQGRDDDLLYRGSRLTEAEEWGRENPTYLNALEGEFLQRSIQLREQSAAEQEARQLEELESARKLAETRRLHAVQLGRRATYLGIAVVGALAMALVALFFGAQARQIAIAAETERRIASARELAAAALNNLSIDPERSILLGLQAIATTKSVDGTVLPEAIDALHNALVASPVRLTLQGHEGGVLSVTYRPTGGELASIGRDGTVIAWESSTGAQVWRRPGTTMPGDIITLHRLVYTPDGRQLLATDKAQAVILDARDGRMIRVASTHATDVTAVTISRDGRLGASGDLAGDVRIWDPASVEISKAWNAHSDAVDAIAFSPDAKWLVTSSEDLTVKLWDVQSGGLLKTYTDFTGLVESVAFSPGGDLLAISANDGLHLWALAAEGSGAPIPSGINEVLSIPAGGAVSFSADGRVLATGGPAALWDVQTGREMRPLIGHTDWVLGTGFSPDGSQLATSSSDGTVKIWDTGVGEEAFAATVAPAGYGIRLAQHPAFLGFAANGGDGAATVWSEPTMARPVRLGAHDQEILSVALSPDGRSIAAGGIDGTVVISDATSGKELIRFFAHADGVRDLAFSPDGTRLATGGFDGTGAVWDAETGRSLHVITGHDGLVVGVAFSPDGSQLATSSTDSTAKIWDSRTYELMKTLVAHTSAITDIAYSPDESRLVTGSKDGLAIIWDSHSGKELMRLAGHRGEIQAVAFSPNGELVATGSGDDTARIWDATSGAELLRLPGDGGGVNGVAFLDSDHGLQLVVGSNNGIIRAFRLQTEQLLELAADRITRSLTEEECREYLHVQACPVFEGQVQDQSPP